MKRRAPETPIRPAVPSPFDLEEDSVELLVTEENGSSSRVICIAIEGEATGVSGRAMPARSSPQGTD